MKKLLSMLAVGLSLVATTAFAQCSSCIGSAPSFPITYSSGQVYGGYISEPVTYGIPMSYSSAPIYSQPAYSPVIYSQPAYTQTVYHQPMAQGCCGQSFSCGEPISYGTPIYHGSMDCGDCYGGGVVIGDGSVIYGDATQFGNAVPMGINVEGAIVQPDVSAAPVDATTPAASGEAVTPPAPEGAQPADGAPQPAPEEKKDGET